MFSLPFLFGNFPGLFCFNILGASCDSAPMEGLFLSRRLKVSGGSAKELLSPSALHSLLSVSS